MIDDLKDKEENSGFPNNLWLILMMSTIFGHHENWFRSEYHEIKEGEEKNDKQD